MVDYFIKIIKFENKLSEKVNMKREFGFFINFSIPISYTSNNEYDTY